MDETQIEIILAHQLAGYLAVPIIIVDSQATVIYYNEPAERLLGRRFDDGPIPPTAWTSTFELTRESGEPMSLEELPLISALRTQQLMRLTFHMRGVDGAKHRVIGMGIPLKRWDHALSGVAGLFWEVE